MRLLAAKTLLSQQGNLMHSSHKAADMQAAHTHSLARMRTRTTQAARALGLRSNHLWLLRKLDHVSSCTRVVQPLPQASLHTSHGTVWQR